MYAFSALQVVDHVAPGGAGSLRMSLPTNASAMYRGDMEVMSYHRRRVSCNPSPETLKVIPRAHQADRMREGTKCTAVDAPVEACQARGGGGLVRNRPPSRDQLQSVDGCLHFPIHPFAPTQKRSPVFTSVPNFFIHSRSVATFFCDPASSRTQLQPSVLVDRDLRRKDFFDASANADAAIPSATEATHLQVMGGPGQLNLHQTHIPG